MRSFLLLLLFALLALPAAAVPVIQLRVNGNVGDSVRVNSVFFSFIEESEGGLDGFDAYELGSLNSHYVLLYTVLGADTGDDAGTRLDIDSRPSPTTTARVFALGVSAVANFAPTGAALALKWPQLDEIPPDWAIVLYDTKTGAQVDLLAADTSYTFMVTAAEDASQRFLLTVGPAQPALALDALLEGAYSAATGLMRTDLSEVLPTTDPYLGTASVAAGYFTTDPTGQRIVDWVLVEVRSGDPTTGQTVVAQMPALLRDDGTVLAADATAAVPLAGVSTGDYYLAVRHRNHLAAMTATAASLTAGLTEAHDFTTGTGQAYGAAPLALATDGRTVLWGGDGNSDGQVTAPDFNAYSAATAAGTAGYAAADYTLDAQVTAPDFNRFAANTALGAQSGIPSP